MGPVTPQDASPLHTPRPLHEEEEDQEPLSSSPVKKKSGEEELASSELAAQPRETDDKEPAEELALSDGKSTLAQDTLEIYDSLDTLILLLLGPACLVPEVP